MELEEEGFDIVEKSTGRIVYTFDDRKDAELFIVHSRTGNKQYEVVGPGERNINRR